MGEKIIKLLMQRFISETNVENTIGICALLWDLAFLWPESLGPTLVISTDERRMRGVPDQHWDLVQTMLGKRKTALTCMSRVNAVNLSMNAFKLQLQLGGGKAN